MKDITEGHRAAGLVAERVETDSLIGIPGVHDYGQVQVNTVLMIMDRSAAYDLGVFLQLVVTSLVTEVEVRLTHPTSRLKTLLLRPRAMDAQVSELPPALIEVRKHPWSRPATIEYPEDWPDLELLSSEGKDVLPQDRSILVGFGTQAATARMASLFIGASNSPVTDIVLEHEPGVPGVRPGSSELIIALPGSTRYAALAGHT